MSDDNTFQKHEGYILQAIPYQLGEDNKWKWKVRVKISNYFGGEGLPFTAEVFFDTKEEAIKQSLIFGKKIIDGDIANLNLDALK